MAKRIVGLIAIGVDDPGVVSRLNGAASGAFKLADWLETQKHLGVDVVSEVLTDSAAGKVGAVQVREAAIRLMTDNALDLLIVYLAGHGFVRAGGSEFVLLSDFPKFQQAIDVAATARNAKRSGGMLGGAFFNPLPSQQFSLAPFCPMMGIGWSLMESYGADEVHPALAQAGRVRLSSEWTLFPTDKIRPLFDAFERGEVK